MEVIRLVIKTSLYFTHQQKPEPVARRCSVKRVFLEISQNSQENNRARVSFLIKLEAEACHFIKIETLAQVFCCEFWETSKNTFCYRTPPVDAFEKRQFVDL